MTKQPFEQIVTQHGATVLRVCRALLARADAEDAWSETFLAALRAYPELPVDANLEAWLVTIAHRKAIDAVRAIARRALPMAEPPIAEASESEPSPLIDDVWTVLHSLPTRQREVVALHHLGQLPYAEVAAMLGGSAAAARRAGADGIAKLRGRLGVAADVTQGGQS